jgi:hypothetical protein
MSEDYCCKFGTVASQYDLVEYLGHLCAEWTRQDGRALRPLTSAFHHQVLHTELIRAGKVPLADEAEGLASALTQSATETTERDHAVACLRQYGIDADTLRRQLPSYRTFARHAKDCAGCEAPTPVIYTDQGPTQVRETVRGYRGRLTRILENQVQTLARAGHIECGTPEVTIRLTVTCQACGDRTPIERVIRSGCPGCTETQPESPPSTQ